MCEMSRACGRDCGAARHVSSADYVSVPMIVAAVEIGWWWMESVPPSLLGGEYTNHATHPLRLV